MSLYPRAKVTDSNPRTFGLVAGLGVGAGIFYYKSLVDAHLARGLSPSLLMVHADVRKVMGLANERKALETGAVSFRSAPSPGRRRCGPGYHSGVLTANLRIRIGNDDVSSAHRSFGRHRPRSTSKKSSEGRSIRRASHHGNGTLRNAARM